MRVGCYCLDLYCTICGTTDQFAGEQTLSKCLQQARFRGWATKQDQELCPDCKYHKRLVEKSKTVTETK